MTRRMTNQRKAILEYLRSTKTHPTADMVYKAISEKLPQITLATVYRNLNVLVEDGQAIKFEVNKEARFDADTSFHQHCICKHCGAITDVFQPEISRYALEHCHAKNFEPETVTIIFSGKCKRCEK